MATCAASAGVLTLIAFLFHAVAGTREFWRFKPKVDPDHPANQSWVQSVAGWQFASVDLLISSIVFLMIAFADTVSDPRLVLSLLSGYYVIVGFVWLLVVSQVGSGTAVQFLKLGQWLFCFVIAALAFVASRS